VIIIRDQLSLSRASGYRVKYSACPRSCNGTHCACVVTFKFLLQISHSALPALVAKMVPVQCVKISTGQELAMRLMNGRQQGSEHTMIAPKVAIVVEAIVGGCAARAGSAAWVFEAVISKIAKAIALRKLAATRGAARR